MVKKFCLSVFAIFLALCYSCQKDEFLQKESLEVFEKKTLGEFTDVKELKSFTENDVLQSFGEHEKELSAFINKVKDFKNNPQAFKDEENSFTDKIEKEINQEAKDFISSIDNVISNIPIENQYFAIEKYEEYLDSYLKNNSEYGRIKKTLLFLKWINYEAVLRYEFLNNDTPEISEFWRPKQDWAPCGRRECVDCCMYRKLQERRNLVDAVFEVVDYLQDGPVDLIKKFLSCGYDCTFS